MTKRNPAAATRTAGMTKIRLVGPGASDSETLWATPLGTDLYRLENSPFFAYGVSWQDVVEARRPAELEMPEFVRRVRRSGNRTLRVIFENSRLAEPTAQTVLQQLQKMGCSYEGMQPRFATVNVPPEAHLEEVTGYLTTQPQLQWEYADPTYDEVQRSIV